MDPHVRARPSPLNLLVPESPAPGSLTEVAEGVLWLRVQLPFRLNHINLWLLKDDDDTWAIVDTGVANPETHALWQTVLEKHKPSCVIATHYHPDHVGNAGWLLEQHKVPFYMPLTEWAYARMISLLTDETHLPTIRRFYTRYGLEAETVEKMVEYGNHYSRNVSTIPAELLRLREGDALTIGGRVWQISTHGGHTPEHMCLYNGAQNILIAGDQVLPFISPNISNSFFEPDADPLSDYLYSLKRLRSLPEDVLVLPSHGLPFKNLHLRIEQLEKHHVERLEQIKIYCAEPRTVTEIMRHLFPQELDRHQIMFAIGEAAAHANHLAAKHQLLKRVDEAGVIKFLTL
jgi:glyoxylase-like metal-dependent hydrolase (beta-lactamase superfamily II)